MPPVTYLWHTCHSSWNMHTIVTPLSLREFVHEVEVGFMQRCNIPQPHSSHNDAVHLYCLCVCVCVCYDFTLTTVRWLHCLVKGRVMTSCLKVRASLLFFVYIVSLVCLFMIIMLLLCVIVSVRVCVCTHAFCFSGRRSVSTRLTLNLKSKLCSSSLRWSQLCSEGSHLCLLPNWCDNQSFPLCCSLHLLFRHLAALKQCL